MYLSEDSFMVSQVFGLLDFDVNSPYPLPPKFNEVVSHYHFKLDVGSIIFYVHLRLP